MGGTEVLCLAFFEYLALYWVLAINKLDIVQVRAHVMDGYLSPSKELGFPFEDAGTTLQGLCRM